LLAILYQVNIRKSLWLKKIGSYEKLNFSGHFSLNFGISDLKNSVRERNFRILKDLKAHNLSI